MLSMVGGHLESDGVTIAAMRRLELHHWILLAMVLGAGVGIPLERLGASGAITPELVRSVAQVGKEIGDVFLSLLKMLVVPLIFSSLVSGVTNLGGGSGDLGRLGGATFGYYLLTSLLGITTGIAVVNLVQPGKGADLLTLEKTAEGEVQPDVVSEGGGSIGEILWRQLTGMIPENPAQALAEGDMLPIIFFAIVFAVFLNRAGEAGKRLSSAFDDLFQVMMKMTLFVIRLAPVGVFGFMLYAAAGKGLDAFVALGWYALTVFLALVIHAHVTLPLLLWVLGRRSPWAYVKALTPALLTAFSTASSNATLPLTMTAVEDRAGIDHRVSSFVLPLGATVNMDGTALYEAVAVLFIAQVYGSDLSLGQQVVVALTALLASVGAAGIPHAGTVMMVVVLEAVGLPLSGVGLILAVDRILDMCRTAVNVWSDATASAVIARLVGDDGGDAAPAPGTPEAGPIDDRLAWSPGAGEQ